MYHISLYNKIIICLLGIRVFQNGLTRFFLVIVVCVCAFANLPLALLAGICKCWCGSPRYSRSAAYWGPGLQYAALRAHLGCLCLCLCLCVVYPCISCWHLNADSSCVFFVSSGLARPYPSRLFVAVTSC